MTPREIIAEAWAIVMRESKIRWWAFTSALLQTLFSLKLLGYQMYFIYEYYQTGTGAGFFDIEIWLYNNIPHGVFFTIIAVFLILVVIELLLPHLCHGALIGLAAKSVRNEPLKGGLVIGLYNFFPLFGIHEFLTLASVSTVITTLSLMARYVESPMKEWSMIMLIILFLLSNFIKFLFSFANEAIVIQKMSVFDAVGKSFKLIVSHLSRVVFLILLMFIISLRIALNVTIVFLIPGIVIGIGFTLSLIFSPQISYTIAGILGVILIIIASYFFAYLQAFKFTVWTLTYLELLKEKDVDVIL